MNKVREFRDAKGISQEELANATGISLRSIQRIEQGKVAPRAYSLRKIAEALDVDFAEFNQQANDITDNAFTLRLQFGREDMLKIFYSCWAGLLFILLLLNIASQVLGDHFLTAGLLFKSDFQVLRSLVSIACMAAIYQVYLLHIRQAVLRPFAYWALVALFSAIPMYIKYSGAFVNTAFLSLNNLQLYLSFFCWLILLFFGLTYKALFSDK